MSVANPSSAAIPGITGVGEAAPILSFGERWVVANHDGGAGFQPLVDEVNKNRPPSPDPVLVRDDDHGYQVIHNLVHSDCGYSEVGAAPRRDTP